MATWSIQSDKKKILVLSIVAIAIGAVILAVADAKATGSANAQAAHWLGLLLAFVGVGGIIFPEDITTTIDPVKRQLTYEVKSRFMGQSRDIAFTEIASIQVKRSAQGKRDYSRSYSLAIVLKSGEILRTGRWSMNEDEIQTLAYELASSVGCEKGGLAEIDKSRDLQNAAISLLIGIAAWVVYYRLKVGPLCVAMWAGTAPPMVIFMAFFMSFSTLRELSRHKKS